MQLFPELVAAINKAVEDKQEPSFRYHLGASLIGKECSRQIWYSFRWALLIKHPGQLLRLFDRGHREEPELIKYMEAAGIKYWGVDPETGKQFRISDHGGHYGGSSDGAGINFPVFNDTPLLGEFKTSNLKWFKDMVKKGVREAKPEHYVQMNQYMGKLDLTHAAYLMVCKDNDELHAEIVEFDQINYDRYLARAGLIIKAQEPPPRCNNNPSWFKCKMCDYAPVCHSTKAPAINCRTCCHATPVVTGEKGQWNCVKGQSEIGDEKGQTKGCTEHLFNPHMLNKTEVITGNTESNWLEIKHIDLGTIKIGPDYVTSKHLQMLLTGEDLYYWSDKASNCWGIGPAKEVNDLMKFDEPVNIMDRVGWLEIAGNGGWSEGT